MAISVLDIILRLHLRIAHIRDVGIWQGSTIRQYENQRTKHRIDRENDLKQCNKRMIF